MARTQGLGWGVWQGDLEGLGGEEGLMRRDDDIRIGQEIGRRVVADNLMRKVSKET